MTVSEHEEAQDAGQEAAPEAAEHRSAEAVAEDLVDEVLPEGLDWERLVRTYPVPALVAAAVGGFWLGSRRGGVIVAALTAWAAAEMTQRVTEYLGDEVL